MSRENVEIVRRIWDGFDDEGLSWLELFDDRCEIRNPAVLRADGYGTRSATLEAAGLGDSGGRAH